MSDRPTITVREARLAVEDVGAKLATWQARLDYRRSAAVDRFRDDLKGMTIPAEVSRKDYAEAQADIVIDRWCQQRDDFAREILSMLNGETVAAAELYGKAAEIGSLIRLHLDNAVGDLDRSLRAMLA